MACTSATLAGLAIDCEQSMGGIQKILIAPYTAGTITKTTWSGATSADTDDVSEAIATISGFTTGSTDWKAYYFRKGNAQATSTLNIDAANGVNYVSTELQMTFTKQDTVKRIEMSALALGEVMVLYKDANGLCWALGIDNPVTCTAGTAQTGGAKTDGNNYQITLTAEDATYPLQLDKATSDVVDAFPYPN